MSQNNYIISGYRSQQYEMEFEPWPSVCLVMKSEVQLLFHHIYFKKYTCTKLQQTKFKHNRCCGYKQTHMISQHTKVYAQWKPAAVVPIKEPRLITILIPGTSIYVEPAIWLSLNWSRTKEFYKNVSTKQQNMQASESCNHSHIQNNSSWW